MKAQVRNWIVFGVVAVISFAGGWVVLDNLKGEEEVPQRGRTDHVREKPGVEPNRLINEQSPYLLQHAYNPVDWYPWGEEAFALAKKLDKPVFLSIGYSTCHWCHVMEKESFMDSTVAAMMNEAFVNVKVDREERPDIDNIYMAVCQMMKGSGGWPLTIVMTPDKKPFIADTYIPKDARYGKPGMLDIIPRISEIWKTQRSSIYESANRVAEVLQQQPDTNSGLFLDAAVLDSAYRDLSNRYDAQYGGFANAPKFPTPHNLLFLLRYWKRSGDAHALAMVEKTLQAMRNGGMYDQLGYGFHRYSTDRQWLIPHFEKMLYDQALLLMAYSEAFVATGKAEYRSTAEEIVRYVIRDMTDDNGAFYSAENADSEGEEGKYYVWTEKELDDILGADLAMIVKVYYNTSPKGNFHEGAGEHIPANVFHITKPLDKAAQELNLEPAKLAARLETAREKLLEQRRRRVPPSLDDKILTDWNGLMIAALAKAGRALDHPEYARAADRAAQFILAKLRDDNGRLLHRYRAGVAGINANLDDYAFLSWGLLELYETNFNVLHLQQAIELSETMLSRFGDTENGGLFFTPSDGEELIIRQKEVYDGAVPSGNSVAKLNLLRLARLTGNLEFEKQAIAISSAFAATVVRAPSAYTMLLNAVDFEVGPSYEVVVVVEDAMKAREMMEALRSKYLPNKVVLLRVENYNTEELNRIAEFTQYQQSIDGEATAYVCVNFACNAPTTDIDQMLELMQ